MDSTAILTRWLRDGSTRDFDLRDLIVITAMTGDEWPTTGALVSEFVLPMLREHQVRYVQVARAGASVRDGITWLDDSRSPDVLYLEGDHTLADELEAAGTVPQAAAGRRLCSAKFKGEVLDRAVAELVGARRHRHAIGFAADERAGRSGTPLARRSTGRRSTH